MGYRKWALILGVLFGGGLSAHDIITTNLTFTRDISRIFARRCNTCHGPGSSIALTTYEEARPWAVAIKEQVLSRSMPPWGAVKGFGHLKPDHALTQEEIMIITGWVIGGAPQGDPSLLAKPTSQAVREPQPQAMSDAVVVSTNPTLSKSVTVSGIRPLPDKPVPSARITATRPDGQVEPLIWLYQYQPESKRTFQFLAPLTLPANTVIQSSSPVRFALEQPTAIPGKGGSIPKS